MKITGHTKVIGLFGHPVEHTLSPAMHNAAFLHLGFNCCYLPFLVTPESLDSAVQAIRALNLLGVNVTVPHKERVIARLDEVDKEARFIGAVNTVVNTRGILSGYNTDGRGFMQSLLEGNIDVEGRKVVVAGAGGGSRAISYYLSEKAESLSLFDPDRAKLTRLAADLSKIRKNVRALDRIERPEDFDILINATPLGLRPGDALPFPTAALGPAHTVCDLIYRKTSLLEEASKQGCRTKDGLGMLLWQGAFAFELWMSRPAPVQVMREALHRSLQEKLA